MSETHLTPVADGITLADVYYQDEPRIIGCGVIETDDGVLLVDPGPDPSIPNLIEALKHSGIGLGDLHAILLTHIHLDHAGGTGTLVDLQPDLTVYVHEKGAPHMIDPERLLRSAGRIYGDHMERLWGRFLPVPIDRVAILHQREWLNFGGRKLLAEPTPGHASHHVAFLDENTGTALTGDVGGIRMPETSYVMPVAPPPDIDVEGWRTSIQAVRGWKSERLLPTHFGPFEDAEAHLGMLEVELESWSAWVKEVVEADSGADALEAFDEFVRSTMPESVVAIGAEPYHPYGQVEATFNGFLRYWTKRLARDAS